MHTFILGGRVIVSPNMSIPLTNVFHILSIMAPMNIVLTLVPRTTNYRKPQQTEKAAHCAMFHVLHCSQHLISLMSWAISRYLEGIDQPDPWWVKVLLDKGFPPAMVEMLRDFLAGTFSPMTSRVSTTMNLLDEHCVMHVQWMVQAHVPIYIVWGHCNKQGKWAF